MFPGAHSCVGNNWMLPPNFQLCFPVLIDKASCASVNVVRVPAFETQGGKHWYVPHVRLGNWYTPVPTMVPPPIDGGIVTTIRKTRGDDIDAACGQLAGRVQDRVKRKLGSRIPVVAAH